jgi:hypothetical protein
MYVAWGWGGRGRGGWFGPWPGRGPLSHLPPWERPGWMFGRGACWSLFGPPAWYGRPPSTGYDYPSYARYRLYPSYYPPPSLEDEIYALQESKKDLEEELKSVEVRIEELKKTIETKNEG